MANNNITHSKTNSFFGEFGLATNLTVTQPSPEYAAKTCGPYWFLVKENNWNHTAFCREESLLRWLSERGLKLSEPLVKIGEHKTIKIIGEYRKDSHSSYDEFYALPAIIETRVLSNGDYTLGRITEDNNGLRTVHHLNPNMKHRPIYDYHESRAIYG